jgi:hypothetical protein
VISEAVLASRINRVPDVSREAFLDVRLEQYVADARRHGLVRYISVEITGKRELLEHRSCGFAKHRSV